MLLSQALYYCNYNNYIDVAYWRMASQKFYITNKKKYIFIMNSIRNKISAAADTAVKELNSEAVKVYCYLLLMR